MSELFDKPRRVTGIVFLGIALLMVVLGQTILSPYLKNFSFIIYWLTCAAFTLSAASVALVDLARVKKVSRDEQRDLLEETLEQIERDKRDTDPKKNDPDKSV